MNQCDGCMAGIPVDENGNHRMGRPGGYPDLMGCTKDRYMASEKSGDVRKSETPSSRDMDAAWQREVESLDEYKAMKEPFAGLVRAAFLRGYLARGSVPSERATITPCDPERQAAPSATGTHQWDEDGERCLKCGAKDWMAGPCKRPCTCHPDDNPPRPCPQKFALSECRAAAMASAVSEPVAWRYRYSGLEDWKYVEREDDCNPHKEYERQPLYAAPTSTPSAIEASDGLAAHNRHAEHCDYCCVIAPTDGTGDKT